jgi:hypothetical protein
MIGRKSRTNCLGFLSGVLRRKEEGKVRKRSDGQRKNDQIFFFLENHPS